VSQNNTFISKASKKSVAKLYTFISKASKKMWQNFTLLSAKQVKKCGKNKCGKTIQRFYKLSK